MILLVGIFFGGYYYLAKTNKIFTGDRNIFRRLGDLLSSSDEPLKGEDQGLVNILLLGIGGADHDGGHLTDTIIVASLNTKTNEVVLTSIPRDFALTLDKYGYNKINAAYAYAFRDDENNAGSAAIEVAEKITGFEIPYYAVIDFKGFVSAVDHVGGVDVVVDRTFTDETFPNDFPYDTKGYIAPVTFNKGPEHMNGQRALIFARSRYSQNANEGSDFARSERQKKVLIAMKDKVLQLNLTDVNTINNLLGDFTENFRTNMEPYELKRLGDLGKKLDSKNIYSLSLEPDGVLICSALVDPKTGKRVIVPPPVPTPPTPPTTTPPTTPPTTSPAPKNPTTTPPTTPPTTSPAPKNPTPTTTPKPTPSPTPNSKLTPTPSPKPTPTTPPTPPTVPTTPEIVRMYVIQPCEGKSLADIHEFLKNASELAKLRKEGAIVEVQNSTGKTGLAATKYNKLIDKGMDLRLTSYTGKVPLDQTIIYDNSHGSKPNTLQ
ncbi:MAG: LCP family protein, partial [Candidatus Doudnabacteria bacterium]|nr:LCP family protein [Candidatus Doudnabacteria bacterium]